MPDNRAWPGFREKGPRQRTLAWLDWQGNRGYIFYAFGQKRLIVSSWEQIKTALFSPEPQLELFCNGIMGQAWFQEALEDHAAQIIVPSQIFNKVSQIQGIRVTQGKYTAWIVDVRAWGIPELDGITYAEMKRLFDLCGVGVRPTPGSLGQAMIRNSWYQFGHGSVYRPNNACRLDILENSIGGRVDYFVSPQDHFTEVHEYDIVSAYSSVSTKLPVGTAIARFSLPREEDGYTTWFMRCVVTIPAGNSTVLGIFAVRTASDVNEYPTTSGTYVVWLWRDEIEACQEVGWQVEVQQGWAWRGWTTGLANWSEQMKALRVQEEEMIGKWVKLATVAGIGRFGMPLYRYRLIREGTEQIEPGDMMLTGSSVEDYETGYVLKRESDLQNNTMSHWFSYILMRCRMVLYRRIKRDITFGVRVLMTNYDAVYTVEETPAFYYEAVEWKHKLLSNVSFPFPRGIISDQKTTLPGVEEHERKHYKK